MIQTDKMKKLTITLLSLLLVTGLRAQESGALLSLDSCRAMAVRNNKELRMTEMRRRAAYYDRKTAYSKFLPRVSATGAYMHTSRELSLLSDGQKDALNNLGTTVGALVPSLGGMAGTLNSAGAGLTEALHTDTRNMGAAALMLTQPVYTGGRIAAYNRITGYAEQIAARQHDLALQNVIVEVDEAYWKIVSLQSRKRLAESYLELVRKLDSDVQQMIDEGVATKADGLSVKVRVNEAQVALIQVNNGLSLSRMSLCQICGMEMDAPVRLADEGADTLPLPDSMPPADVRTALEQRPELRALSLTTDIYREKIRLARAEFMPTVALTGGYMASNPSLFNSFQRQFKGMWSVGVMVNVPVLTCGERWYRVKAVRAQACLARYQLEEQREKVELQVSQCRQKIEEAGERLRSAMRSREEADENLRYATLGMREGVMPVLNVLEAQTAWLSAHSECVRAQIDLRLAHLYMRKASGTLAIGQ